MRRDRTDSAPSAEAISRRRCVGQLAFGLAVGVSLISATGTSADPAKPPVKKASKTEVSYQDQPKGKSAMCADCRYFEPPKSCEVVDGIISPAGWCQRFEKKA